MPNSIDAISADYIGRNLTPAEKMREKRRQELIEEGKLKREQNLYEQQAQLAHRQQQAAMRGINRGIRGGGLNPFQEAKAIENLQKIATRGNKAIGSLPREQQLIKNRHPELLPINAPYEMYSGDRVFNNLKGAFERDQRVARKNYQDMLDRLEEERQAREAPRFMIFRMPNRGRG